MYGSLDISTSGLIAQRTRLAVSALNIANQHTIVNAEGNYEPFQRRIAYLGAGDPMTGSEEGVNVTTIALDEAAPLLKYEPDSPFANEDGYVGYPNISPVVEQMNAMEAMRSYEANIAAIEATKSMMSIALQMLA